MPVGTSLRPLRRLAGTRPLLPLTALLLRARTVRPATSFLAREAARRKGTFVYTLRASGLQVAIRHRTGDIVTLGEVFHERAYEPTPDLQGRLGQVARVVDLGANVGLFGAYAAARWPRAQILAYEPDPANADVHERTVEINALQARWKLVRAAAGASAGHVAFIAGEVALSHLAGEDEGAPAAGGSAERPSVGPLAEGRPRRIEVACEDVVPQLAGADLVKMDIEGGEWAILEDTRFRASPPRVVVLEYHPRFCPTADPRAAVQRALALAGLSVLPVWHRADGHGMLWAWQS